MELNTALRWKMRGLSARNTGLKRSATQGQATNAAPYSRKQSPPKKSAVAYIWHAWRAQFR